MLSVYFTVIYIYVAEIRFPQKEYFVGEDAAIFKNFLNVNRSMLQNSGSFSVTVGTSASRSDDQPPATPIDSFLVRIYSASYNILR